MPGGVSRAWTVPGQPSSPTTPQWAKPYGNPQLAQTNNIGQNTVWNQFSQSYVPVSSASSSPAPKPAAAPSSGGGSSAPSGPAYTPPPLPSVGPVPVNNGNLPSVDPATAQGSMSPPSAPGAGWQSIVGGGGLNDKLGNRLQRQSMNQLSAGIY